MQTTFYAAYDSEGEQIGYVHRTADLCAKQFPKQERDKYKFLPFRGCPDCGQEGESRGHMSCEFPSN